MGPNNSLSSSFKQRNMLLCSFHAVSMQVALYAHVAVLMKLEVSRKSRGVAEHDSGGASGLVHKAGRFGQGQKDTRHGGWVP